MSAAAAVEHRSCCIHEGESPHVDQPVSGDKNKIIFVKITGYADF